MTPSIKQRIQSSLKLLIPMVIYMVFYMIWFYYLEQTVTTNFHLIHMKIDDYIPFCELFIIPYELWFPYVACTIVFLAFCDKEEYQNTCIFLCLGMTLFLIVSTVYPNGHDLRLAAMPRDNIFTKLVVSLQKTDTPTNLFPSIHVYNSIGINLGICRSHSTQKHKWIRIVSSILCVLIIFSTILIKQHSVFDLLTAFICAILFYMMVYKWKLFHRFFRK